MSKLLRLLHVEDSEADAELITREIRRGGYEVKCLRVESGPDLRAALVSSTWDLVIADYSLPHFSGPEALFLVRRLFPPGLSAPASRRLPG